MGACCSACARRTGLGVAPTPEITSADKINLLRQQVNRFRGPSAPPIYRLAPTLVAPIGDLDLEVAMNAAVLYQRRAAEAYESDTDALPMLMRGNEAISDAVTFVRRNLDEVLSVVKTYGDLNKLPPAKNPNEHPAAGYAALAGVALLFLMLARSK